MSDFVTMTRPTLEAEAAYAGTSHRRAIVVLRFDDTPTQDMTVVLPLLERRSLVAGFAVAQVFLSDFGGLGDPNGGKGLSVAQCLDLQARGMELMCHSRRHRQITSAENFVDEVATWGDEARALGMSFDAFVQPGTWTGDWYFDSLAKFRGFPGEIFADNYAAVEAYVNNTAWPRVRAAPAPRRFGNANITTEISTLTSLQAYVDNAVRLGGCAGFLTHTLALGTTGRLSLADFTSFLDYVAARRDAGDLDVVAPTSSLFSRQADAPRSVLADGSFRRQATGAISPPWYPVGSPTVSVGTGEDGGNAIRAAYASVGVRQWLSPQAVRRIRFEGFARGISGAAGTARVISRGQNSRGQTSNADRSTAIPAGAGWTKVVHHFGVDARSSEHQLWLASGSGEVWWSNVRAYKA